MNRRGLAAIVAAVALAGAATVATAAVATEPAGAGRFAAGAALDGVFATLEALERRQARLPVRFIQIGDSHTANDSFSGRLRERLQARFGSAGRGWLPAGVPFAYYRPQLVTVGEAGWRHFRPGGAGPNLPFGIDASLAEPATANARMMLTDAAADGFDRFAVEFVARPDSGNLTIRIDQEPPIQVATAAPRAQVRHAEIATPRGARQVELGIGAPRSALLLGWTVERRQPGVIYENHGTIGATIGLIERLNPAVVAYELAERHPALIVVAFGANEGFDDALDAGRYAARFAAAVSGLQKKARGAAILVLGPPDGARRSRACGADEVPASCRNAAPAAVDCAWQVPPSLARVRAVQRRVAAQRGWAFWDWAAALGGTCGMHALATRDPPLAMPDRVHFTTTGYAAAADTLFGDLMQLYDSSRQGRTGRR